MKLLALDKHSSAVAILLVIVTNSSIHYLFFDDLSLFFCFFLSALFLKTYNDNCSQ